MSLHYQRGKTCSGVKHSCWVLLPCQQMAGSAAPHSSFDISYLVVMISWEIICRSLISNAGTISLHIQADTSLLKEITFGVKPISYVVHTSSESSRTGRALLEHRDIKNLSQNHTSRVKLYKRKNKEIKERFYWILTHHLESQECYPQPISSLHPAEAENNNVINPQEHVFGQSPLFNTQTIAIKANLTETNRTGQEMVRLSGPESTTEAKGLENDKLGFHRLLFQCLQIFFMVFSMVYLSKMTSISKAIIDNYISFCKERILVLALPFQDLCSSSWPAVNQLLGQILTDSNPLLDNQCLEFLFINLLKIVHGFSM